MNPDHLRASIEKIGIEKPSDYTLVLEEVERMEAEEKRLLEKCGEAVRRAESGGQYAYANVANAALVAAGYYTLLRASEAFIKEAEEMGWGKTSDKALPGSFDLLLKVTREVKG